MNGPMRLLIADDDPVMRMLLGAIARDAAALELVAEAQDADEAIALAVEHTPDVVLLDVEMPGGGGLRAAREIRAALPTVRVVGLSAHESDEARGASGGGGGRRIHRQGRGSGEVARVLRRADGTAPRCRSLGNADDGVAGGFEGPCCFSASSRRVLGRPWPGPSTSTASSLFGPVQVGLDAVDVRVHERLREAVEQ